MRYHTIISATDLKPNLKEPQWIVLDCRFDLLNPRAGYENYQAGHIPGAQFADLNQQLSDTKPAADGRFRGRHPLPSKETFLQTLRLWGINQDSQVVAYDAHGGVFAARLWWLLRWIGHSRVAVLDGGLSAWMAHGEPLEVAENTVQSARPPGNIQLQAPLGSTVTVDEIAAHLNDGVYSIIDARAPDRFRGENETIDPVGGHIPGAKNRFFKNNLQENGLFKSAEQLRQEWAALINPKTLQQNVMQCGSGITACHNLLALEIAGLPGAALYPGSWSEWCADPARPVAMGQ